MTSADAARAPAAPTDPDPTARRVAALDWPRLHAELDEAGHAVTPALLGAGECAALAALYADDAAFRSTVDVARHGFGEGQYRYFSYPLPEVVGRLRRALYPPLAALARRWAERVGAAPEDYPEGLDGFSARCHAAGQRRPTPLLLRYEAGGHNCRHRELCGAVAFPLQVAVALSAPGEDDDGGEFLLVEQRPRLSPGGWPSPSPG